MLRFLFSVIATLLVLPILVGLLRRVTGMGDHGPRGSRSGRGRGSSTAGRAGGAAGDATPIDRTAVIDVPFTEVGGEAPAEKAAAGAADGAHRTTGS